LFDNHLKTTSIPEKSKIERILEKLSELKSNKSQISPSFEWAQAIEVLFIQIKFSIAMNFHGCVDTSEKEILYYSNLFFLSTECLEQHNQAKYELFLELDEPLANTGHKFAEGGQGKYILTLKKKYDHYWKRLVREGTERANMKIWYERNRGYEEDMEMYREMMESDELNKKPEL